jgi:nucleoside-triphosphatase THEP1
MNFAFTNAPGKGDTDLLLLRLAQSLMSDGMRVCGTVQVNTERPCKGPCDMDVRVLPDGPVLRISQDLGACARGCRLDPAVLVSAVDLVSKSLETKPDILIVNKFGKLEAEGGGFRPVIADALALGIPVLVGLNSLNEAAFQTFAAGLAVELPPKHKELHHWASYCLENGADTRPAPAG